MRLSRSMLSALLVALGTFQGCLKSSSPADAAIAGQWDADFTAASLEFPNDSIQQRSVRAHGDAYRLSRFFRKCGEPGRVRIGFIGGSITGGALASRPEYRYSSRLRKLLSNAFPLPEFIEINAGIAATNSRFAASRVADDLLAKAPDLIIIEFAVNDDHHDTAATAQAMEGLIRQCLRDSEVPVLLFQTMNRSGEHRNHEIQEKLATHYALPVISYHAALRPLIEAGSIPWSSLSQDEFHPNDEGHRIAAYLLMAFLNREHESLASGEFAPANTPGPLVDDRFERAGMFKVGDSLVSVSSYSGWWMFDAPYHRINLGSDHLGDSLVLNVSVREITLLYRIATTLDASVEVSLDGTVVDTLSNRSLEDLGSLILKPKRIFLDSVARDRRIKLKNVTGGAFDLRYILYCE